MNCAHQKKRLEGTLSLIKFETLNQRSELHSRNSELSFRTVATIALAGAFLPTAMNSSESAAGDKLLLVQISAAILFGIFAIFPRKGMENNIRKLKGELMDTPLDLRRVYVERINEVLVSDKKILRRRNRFSLVSMCLLVSSLFTFAFFAITAV